MQRIIFDVVCLSPFHSKTGRGVARDPEAALLYAKRSAELGFDLDKQVSLLSLMRLSALGLKFRFFDSLPIKKHRGFPECGHPQWRGSNVARKPLPKVTFSLFLVLPSLSLSLSLSF